MSVTRYSFKDGKTIRSNGLETEEILKKDNLLNKPDIIIEKVKDITKNKEDEYSKDRGYEVGIFKEKVIDIVKDKKVNDDKKDYYEINLDFITDKIKEKDMVRYKINPSTRVNNDKILMVLNEFSRGYKEMYQSLNDITFEEGKIGLPNQDVMSFEILVKRESVDFYLVLERSNSEKFINDLKYAWSESVFEEIDYDVITDIVDKDLESIAGYEIRLKNLNSYMLNTSGKDHGKGFSYELLELSRLMKDGDSVIWQICMEPSENDWWKHSKDLLDGSDKPKDLDKFKYGGCDVSMRLIVDSDCNENSVMLGSSFVMLLGKLNSDNELKGSLIKETKKERWIEKKVKKRKVDVSFLFKRRNIFSVKELSYFINLPVRSIQKEFNLDIDEKKYMKIDSKLLRKDGVLVGEVTHKGKTREIRLNDSNLDDFSKSYCYIGSPRTGKDTSIINFIVESAKRGHGAIIPDAINEMGNDRGMADSIRDALPADMIIDISLDDYNFPVYFGMEDVMTYMGENGPNIMADNLLQILNLGDKYESKKLARLVAKACNCNLYDMYCFMKSEKFQRKVLSEMEDELLALEVEHEFILNKPAKNVSGAILTRLDDLMGNSLLKYMFAQDINEKFDLRKWMSEGKVVIIRMTKSNIGELGTKVLMYLLVLRIFEIKKQMDRDPKLKDRSVFIVFNEFFQYMSDNLEQLLQQMVVQCPKFRLGMLFAFHTPSSTDQISKNFWETLKSSSLNYFLFKNTNSKVYKDMDFDSGPISVESAMKTDKFESVFLPYVDRKQLEPFFLKMTPPPALRQKMYDNSLVTENHKSLFGTPVRIIKERILERELWMYRLDDEEGEED